MLLVVLALLLRAQVLLEYRWAESRSLMRMSLFCHKAKYRQDFSEIRIFFNTYSCHVGILLITGNLKVKAIFSQIFLKEQNIFMLNFLITCVLSSSNSILSTKGPS